MKKTLIVCLLWSVVMVSLFAWQCGEWQPSKEFTSDNHICQGNEKLYISDNTVSGGHLYEMNRDNTLLHVGLTDEIHQESRYEGIDYQGELYALISTEDVTNSSSGQAYQLIQYSENLKVGKTSGWFALNEKGTLSGFDVDNQNANITLISKDGTENYLYQLSLSALSKEENQAGQPDLTKIQQVRCQQLTAVEENRVFARTKFRNNVLLTWLDDTTGYTDFEPNQDLISRYQEMKVPFQIKIKMNKNLLIADGGIWLVGIAVLFIAGKFLKNRRKMFYIGMEIEIFLLVIALIGTGYIDSRQKQTAKEEYIKYGQYCMTALQEQANVEQIETVETEFYSSDTYQELESALRKFTTQNSAKDTFLDVMVINLDSDQILASSRGMNGTTIQELYGAEAESVLKQIKEGKVKSAVDTFFGGKKCEAVAAVSKDTTSPSYALVGMMDLTSLQSQNLLNMKKILIVEGISFLIASLFAAILIRLQSRDLVKLERAMKSVASGKMNLGTHNDTATDLGTMWNSLYETDKTIKAINYNKYKLLEAYYRFTPKDIEKLLDKDSIADVVNGDTRSLTGTLALFSIHMKQEDMENMAQNMNRFLSAIDQSRKRQNGIFISSDCDFALMKLLFLEGSNSVAFGIDFMQQIQGDAGLRAISSCIFLHHDRFTYGITGNETQSFSFLKSQNNLNLERFSSWLRSMGLKLVITKEVQESEYPSEPVRNLGYVKVSGDSQTIELYEVLEACPDQERREKLENLEKFAQGLKMFYQHDFYLARNTFSEVLKSMPTDKITKWYLFTCEKYLNEVHSENISCALGDWQ